MAVNRRTMALASLVLGMVLVLIWGARVGTAAWRLRRNLAFLQSLDATAGKAALPQLCTSVRQMDADMRLLRREAGLGVAAAPLLGWFPRWGGTLRAAPALVEVAQALTHAGRVGCELVSPLLAGDKATTASLPFVLDALQEHQADLEQVTRELALAQEAWEQVDSATLVPFVARRADLLDQALPLAHTFFSLMRAAPDLLGQDGPRTYLVLALNESELRPGGGFISAAGEVEVHQGQLKRMSFMDSYALDNFHQPYPQAPEPFRRYMGIDLLVYRDSNWWPDFPAAVQAAWPLYRPATPAPDYAGVIAVDQRALELLLSAVGEVSLPDSSETLTAQNVRAYIRRSWEPPGGDPSAVGWWSARKSIMGPLAAAIGERLQAGQFDPARLGYGVWVMLREKHVQIVVQQPQAAAALRAQGWDGSLPHELDGDFVFLVDANVGYNKVNERVRQAITYTVDLRPAAPIAELRAVYTNTVTRDVSCEPFLGYPPTYQEMIERCYWDYIRVYAHPQATLLEARADPVPASALLSGEAEDGAVKLDADPFGHWRVFAGLMVLPVSSIQERWWRWALPADVVAWQVREGTYRLHLQKQAGVMPYPVTVRVILPSNVSVLRAEPAPSRQAAGEVSWQTLLDRDRDFVLELRRP